MRYIKLLLLLVPSICIADDYREKLFERANSGDAKAQNELAFVYGHWSSQRYNSDKLFFWHCLAAKNNSEEAKINLGTRLGASWKTQCDEFIKVGYEKKFNEYLKSGSNLGEIKLKSEIEETYTVPSERFWRVEWSKQDCPKVCKSELAVKGKIYSDSQKSTAIYGEFQLNAQGESSVIWLFPETELRVNFDGTKVLVTEFVQ